MKFALLVVWRIDTLRSRASWCAFYPIDEGFEGFQVGVVSGLTSNAREGNRTLTPCDGDQILSLACLPIPPLWLLFQGSFVPQYNILFKITQRKFCYFVVDGIPAFEIDAFISVSAWMFFR